MSSFDRLWSAELIASTDPCTSAFTSTGNSITFDWRPANMVSKLVGASAVRFSVALVWRNSATSRARCSFSTTVSVSPALGTPPRPRTSTGMDGPASLICVP
jgi:hypothetical protein